MHGEPTHDWQALRESKNKELQRLSNVYKKNLESGKVDFIEGLGKVVDEHTVEVKGMGEPGSHKCKEAACMPVLPAENAISATTGLPTLPRRRA